MNLKTPNQYVILFLLISSIFFVWLLADNKNEEKYINGKEYIFTGYDEHKELIENLYVNLLNTLNCSDYQGKEIKAGIISHHTEVATPLVADFYTKLKCDNPDRHTFVIIGPDHFERGKTSISTANLSYATPFGTIEINQNIVNDLIKVGVGLDNQALTGEHSVNSQAIFIKYLFPNAKIVPLVFKAYANEESLKDILEVLLEYEDKITLVFSVDFSHYHPYQEARIIDQESYDKIRSLKFDDLTLDSVDSPISIKLLQQFVDIQNLKDIVYISRINSYDYTGREDNTTGYISALFSRLNQSQLFFVGDVMLSRSVGEKMERENNWKWPFLKISQYLQEADLLFGNLEGPISNKGKDMGGAYSFRANPQVIDGLKYAGFDILSVANNHIGDWDREAMEDTFKALKENGIDYVGGGFNEEEAYSSIIKELDNGTKIAFLAYTNLGSKYWQAKENQSGIAWLEEGQIEKDIKKAKTLADIVIISMHFGEEYILHSNSAQQSLSKAAIDAGANLIIGHHPHVVQEIEKYKNSYIIYSLGNFVFDQLFSKEVRNGLILKVVINNKQIKEIKSINIEISNSFQPEIISK